MAPWRTRGSRIVLVAALVAGCAARTGTISGEISSRGQPAQPVTFSYVPDRTDDSGTIFLNLPDGEAFSGRYARAGTTGAAAVSPGLDIDFSATDWGFEADRWTFGQGESDRVVAVLQGNHGGKIRCLFRLVYAGGGMGDGGTGECQVTTGQRIVVKF
jgi:hypothetical protein